MACDCGLVAVGHDGQGLNIGRRARSIPPAIRRALMLRDWAEENGLHLGPETNMPRWDGTSPDYELAVSVLL